MGLCLVNRRVGGLENHARELRVRRVVNRRVGGLEMTNRQDDFARAVNRRVGGFKKGRTSFVRHPAS